MATDASIQAYADQAVALGLTDRQMAALCRRAIADLLANGRPMTSYRIAGQEFSFSMTQAQQLLNYFDDRADTRGGNGFVVSLAEM